MFNFFLQSYRSGILDFCGMEVKVTSDVDGKDGKVSFKEFENGVMKLHELRSRHPNILKGVIVGKKSWGLWLQEWTDGISEGSFSPREILSTFGNIKIPDPLLTDFYNVLIKKIMTRYTSG
jgi:hypothetical protein